MTLVVAGPGEAPLLAAIHAACFPPGAAWDAETLSALLGMEGAFALRAGEEGFVLARLTLDEAEILTLAVRPEARRGGRGAALVGAAIEAVAAAGAKVMFLEVAESNGAAMGLYLEAGFSRIGLRRDYYGQGDHAVAMRRFIPG